MKFSHRFAPFPTIPAEFSEGYKQKKGFVIPTKSFGKIGIGKIFCYNNKMFGSIIKTFGCCGKIFGSGDKKIIFCP